AAPRAVVDLAPTRVDDDGQVALLAVRLGRLGHPFQIAAHDERRVTEPVTQFRRYRIGLVLSQRRETWAQMPLDDIGGVPLGLAVPDQDQTDPLPGSVASMISSRRCVHRASLSAIRTPYSGWRGGKGAAIGVP